MSGRRFFRALLRLLPFDFRSDYGPELQRTFADQQREARSRGERARVWAGNLAAILAIGPREHLVQLRQDVRHALRGMRRNPGFVAVAVLTLALGTGVNTAIFGIVHAVLLAPLPYPGADRLVSVMNRWDGQARGGLSDPEYLDYAELSTSLVLAAMNSGTSTISGGGGEPERVPSAGVSHNVFEVLGQGPVLGRGFSAADVQSEQGVVIISDATWRERFAASPDVLGRTLVVGGSSRTVVGVLPPGFILPSDIQRGGAARVLLPLQLDPAAPRVRRGGHYLTGVGRLKPGATLPAASAEMDAIVARLIRQYPDEHNQGNFGIVVTDLREELLGDSRPVLWMLGGAVALVLLLACANVANLMMARGEARRRELSVRSALGASRFRMARQLVTEALVLGVLATALGVAPAHWLTQVVLTAGPAILPRLSDVRLSVPVLAFAAFLALATTLLFGALPAWQLSRTDAGDALKDAARGGSSGSRTMVRRALVVCQVTVAMVLLVGAGLLLKSYARVLSVPSGFDPQGLMTARVNAPAGRYSDLAAVSGFFTRVVEAARALPGVEAAGASSGLPLAVASGDWGFDIEGRARVNGRRPGRADWYVVTPGYMEAMRIPVRAGRAPLESDTEAAPPVIFINESAAAAMFPGQDPIGKRVRLSNTTGPEQPWRTIAGVVADVRQRGLDSEVRTEMFIPYRQFQHFAANVQARSMTVVVRAGERVEALTPSLRGELRRIDPEVPLADARLMTDVMSASVADRRLHLLLVGVFAALAVVLATIGVYGVIAYDVLQRTREIGIRVALGATRQSVLTLMLRRGLTLVLIGSVVGLAAAAVATGPFSELLFEVSPRDLVVFVSVALLLAGAGGLASYVPAWRATRVDPLTALRHD
jgi:putative ABC transport system permease protein